MLNDWDEKQREFENAEKKAIARLLARKKINPRLGVTSLTAEMYPAMKEYDALLANEIVYLLKKEVGSIPELPDYSKTKTKGDWASSAYDR